MADETDTRKKAHHWGWRSAAHGPGLLRFHPLGHPPRMRFTRLGDAPLLIGRGADCALRLDHDAEVSRQHAQVQPLDEGWQLVDRGSANGVFVDGREVRAQRLQPGAVIRIGGTFFRFLAEGTAATDFEHRVERDGFVGGPSLASARKLLQRAADGALAVLLEGATGTGKEVAARALHAAGRGKRGPFVALNCAAIPAELFESELFGHVRGAFSGATEDFIGQFRAADGGTLFLDEIDELKPRQQAKLLRVLQDGLVLPVGSARPVQVKARVVCATNRELKDLVQQGAFRDDLLARIAELVIRLPGLDERLEDIPLLVAHFCRKHGAPGLGLPVQTVECLCCMRWPQNVRQLENAVRRALLFASDDDELLPRHFVDPECGADRRHERNALEPPSATQDLASVLRLCEGDVQRAARKLGLSRSQLYRRAQQAGLRPAAFRRAAASARQNVKS